MHQPLDVANLDVNFLIFGSNSPITNNVPTDISIVNNSINILPVEINNNNNNNDDDDADDADADAASTNSINVIPVFEKTVQIGTTTKSGQFILDASVEVNPSDIREIEENKENKDFIVRDTEQNRVLIGEGHFGRVFKSYYIHTDGRSSVNKKLKGTGECTKEAEALIDVFDQSKMVTTQHFTHGFSNIIMENMVDIGYVTLEQLLWMNDEQFSALASPFTCRSQMIEPITNAMVIALYSVNQEKNYTHFDLNHGNIFVNVRTLDTCQSISGSGIGIGSGSGSGSGIGIGSGSGSNIRNPVVLGDFGCARKMDALIPFYDTNGHENYKSLQRYWNYDQHITKTTSFIRDNEDIFSLGVLIFEMLLAFVHPSTPLFKQNVLFLLKFHGIEIVPTGGPNNCCTTLKVAFSNDIRNFTSNTQFTTITFDSMFNPIISQIINFIQYYRNRPNASQVLESLINNHQYSLNNLLPPIFIENPDDKHEPEVVNSSDGSSALYLYDTPSFEITITHNNFNQSINHQ
ncbi:hypothetical protein ACTFIR_000743 [Dictyostelium discoideum]